MCLPYLKFSDLLPETHLFFIWPDLKHSSCEHVISITVENSADPDQMACQKPADLDLHFFQNKINPGAAGQGFVRQNNMLLLLIESISMRHF